MENHFGKGLIAGLQASSADTAAHAANFCADYKRGFVLGYSHRMFEKTGVPPAQRVGGGDPHRRYGLDRDMVMDFFKEGGSEYGDALFSGGLSAGKLNRTARQAGASVWIPPSRRRTYAWRLSSVWVSKSRASWR